MIADGVGRKGRKFNLSGKRQKKKEKREKIG